MRRLGAAMLAGGGVLLAVFASCSDANPGVATPADGGTDAAIEDGARKDWNVEPPDTGPEFNVDGWLRLDYPGCNFYAAPSADKMPAALAWEPCSSIVAPLGITCSQLKHVWPPPAGGASPGVGALDGWVDAAGKAWLALGYNTGAFTVKMVAEAEGPVHHAISTTRTGECILTRGSVSTNKVIWTILQPGGKTRPDERGAIGGGFDQLPLVLEHWDDGLGRSYYAGPLSYFTLGAGNAVRSWTTGAPSLGNVVLTDPGQMSARIFVGEELFYEVTDLSYGRIKVYSPANGARDLVSFGNDVSKRAVNFGTDGVDMVWVEAFGRAAVGAPWSTINIVTAKYTTEASAIQKRRLRSEGSAVGVAPFVVGCGYAAHFVSTSADGNVVRIVRLSDGRSWKLPEIFADGGVWLFQDPYAITCEDIFISVLSTNGTAVTARVRIDSLGPGDPAD